VIDEKQIEALLKSYEAMTMAQFEPVLAEIRRRVGAHARLVAALREIADGWSSLQGRHEFRDIALKALGGGAQGEAGKEAT